MSARSPSSCTPSALFLLPQVVTALVLDTKQRVVVDRVEVVEEEDTKNSLFCLKLSILFPILFRSTRITYLLRHLEKLTCERKQEGRKL